ncbi:Glutathione S-transferase A4 [Apophysomyces sp. BC1034]|nr:Glutathione S-transferase A4 [Apophysomyces sp. BC1015]KAG0180742.1 Glutathione S-transferase A4 [Apophysomyces sp. BC1021]KAG0187961.1 Glutathione S-transferase A4 [Apophysomyces sp. BC1034]
MSSASFPKVTLTYFDIPISKTIGLGEHVKLLLEDANIDHEYIKVLQADWPAKKESLIKEGYLFGTLPMLEIEGKRIGKTVPIMRYISQRLGKYLGSNQYENQYLDALADTATDWGTSWGQARFRGTEEQKKEHQDQTTPKYLGIFEKAYAEREGPYILGQEISYVDFLFYHRVEDEEVDYKAYPHIAAFVKAFTERPNLKNHLASVKV